MKTKSKSTEEWPRRPNLVLCYAHDTGVDPFVNHLAAHPSIGLVGADDFDHVEGDLECFPLKNFAPEFTNHPECKDAFDAIALRLAGNSEYIAWAPTMFMEFAHTVWTTCFNLPTAKYVFCLRNPTDAVYVRHLTRRHEMPHNLSEALDSCEKEMAEVGQHKNRGKWDAYLRNPTETSNLLQCSAYEPVLSRCLRLIPRDQVSIVLYEDFEKAPAKLLNSVWNFLGLPGCSQPVAPPNMLPITMKDETRTRLNMYFEELNEKLAKLLRWQSNPWR